jgi:hypothetical protein
LPWRLEPLHLPFSAPGLIAWVEETDLDGFNLAYAVAPETFADFVDLVAPELQSGRHKRDSRPERCARSSTAKVARGSAQIIQQSGSAILPICPAVDERVGRDLATPPSAWTRFPDLGAKSHIRVLPPRGTDGSNPAPSSGESVSLPPPLSKVENPGFPRRCARLAWRLGRQRRAGLSISRQPAAISLSGHIPVPQRR